MGGVLEDDLLVARRFEGEGNRALFAYDRDVGDLAFFDFDAELLEKGGAAWAQGAAVAEHGVGGWFGPMLFDLDAVALQGPAAGHPGEGSDFRPCGEEGEGYYEQPFHGGYDIALGRSGETEIDFE